MAKSKFSRSERTAYNSGMGYAVAYSKKGIKFQKRPELRKSFSAGFNKGLEMITSNPENYPNLKRKTRNKKG